MHSARPFTRELKDKSGKRCITTTKICTRRLDQRSLGVIKRQKLCGRMNFMTQPVMRTCKEELKLDGGCGEEHLLSPAAALAKALECLEATNER